MALMPFLILLWPYILDPQGKTSSEQARAGGSLLQLALSQGVMLFGFLPYILALLTFGFSPLLLPDPYSISALGWTMFSGRHSRSPIYTMKTPNARCFRFGFSEKSHIVKLKETETEFLYTAKRVLDLERLRAVILHKRHCTDQAAPLNDGYLKIFKNQ